MRPTRLIAAVLLGAALSAPGCTTVYYQSHRPGGQLFTVQTGRDTTDFGADEEAGKGRFIQPWVLAACLSHESTNLPFYYERISSWEGNAPAHFMLAGSLDAMLTEWSDRRDTTDRMLRANLLQPLLAGTDPKKEKHVFYGRACAASAAIDTWLGCGEALFRKGYARYGWGHKPDVSSDKFNLAGFSFYVTVNPEAQTVSVLTTRRDLAGGFAIQMKKCVFDVSQARAEATTKDGRKVKVGAFDWVDVDGNNLATEATFDEIGDWEPEEVPRKLSELLGRTLVLSPEVAARGVKYMGPKESIRD